MAKIDNLITGILDLSVADTWSEAKHEWELDFIEFAEEAETCLCTHTPIIELCFIKNVKNGKQAIVGNYCVKKFLGLPSGPIFSGVKRVKVDEEKALNEDTIEFARSKGWLTDREYKFSMDTKRKRVLSARQMNWRRSINAKVLRLIANGARKK